jgi:hypothetical protein
MESAFTYLDIFATKGIEYIVIISFFVIIVAFWKYLHANDD